MNRIHKLAIPVLLLMMCAALSGASAQPAIKAGDGESLPDSIDVDETFTVLITENGSPVGAGTHVVFRLLDGTGDPVYCSTDVDGKVNYMPLVTGTLGIKVLDGTVTVAEATVDVTDITSGTTQPSDSPGGSGGGDYLPPATPTVTATAAPTAPPGATPEVTPGVTHVEVVETPVEVEVETPAPTPKLPKKDVPGFTAVSVIAGLLAALYPVLRRRE